MPWILRGLRNGILTSRWPKGRDEYFDGFDASVAPSRVTPDTANAMSLVTEAAALCPTSAINVDPVVSVDRGRCILCARCIAHAPDSFRWRSGADTARPSRSALVLGEVVESDAALAAVRGTLARRVRRLRRSVHIRHVDAGSDGSDEWEVQALTNPIYDVHRLGIFFTASPRHADILLATGIGTAGMVEPLRRTLDAMPSPTVVIAAGTDAVSGGLIGHGYTRGTGLGDLVDVDVWIPGAPASPFSLLHGILLALGRLPTASRSVDAS